MDESHYEVLGVSPYAEDVVIEGAYKALVKRYHPDLYAGDTITATARTARINEAYRVLKDPSARARYDRELGLGAGSNTSKADRARGRDEPPPPRPQPAPTWTAPPAAPPPTPPASGRAKLISATYAALAVALIGTAMSSFKDKGVATPSVTAPPSEPVARARRPPTSTVSRPTVEATKTYETSFDCRKADGAVVALICADEELAAADREMAARYKEVLTTVDPPDELRAAQRQWLRAREASVADRKVLLRLYKDRMLELGSDQAIIDQLY